MMRTACFAAALFLSLGRMAPAQEPIQMARTPDISPDGKLVTFSYLGDIWVVEAIGGTARPVTMHRGHEFYPVFSPDGRTIAFSSNRNGSYNVFTIPVHSGKPTQLTFESANDYVTGWSPDGKYILFASTRSTAFPAGFELYRVPVEGGRAERVSAAEGKDGVYSPSGDKIAYVRGPGTWYRKGYRGSSNDDIWISNADGTNNRKLTNFEGQDAYPAWSADGQWLYYSSEQFGTPANIVRVRASEPNAKPEQVTRHKDDAVRRLRMSKNGQWIVYECGADLWVVSTQEGSSPRKLAVEVHTDDKSSTERTQAFSNGVSEYAVTADERFIAFALHGELFKMAIGSNSKPQRMTTTNCNNHAMAWSPDGGKLVFVSDREGQEDIYLLESADTEHPKLVEAHSFKTTRLTNTKDPEAGVAFSPDGKLVSFIRAGKLWTMSPDGTNQKPVVNEPQVFDYDWAPDSKWIVFARTDGSFASELYITPAGGPTKEEPVRNITRFATFNGDVTWSANGRMISFLSTRRSTEVRSLFVLSLLKPLAQGVATPTPPASGAVEIDWDNLHNRATRVAPGPIEHASVSPDGLRVAFRAPAPGNTGREEVDLWVANSNGSQLTRVTTGNMRPQQITWSKRRSPLGTYLDVVYFRDGNGGVHMARLSGGTGTNGTQVAQIPFQVKLKIRTEDEFLEMFEQSWRYLADNFYDKDFHGANWDAVRAKYKPLVKHVVMKEDLYSLLYLMMGELNASHLGVSGPPSQPDEPTADLGLIFDEKYKGTGLKVAEILKRGPADRRGLNLKAGDFVMAIDGVELTDKVDVATLLNGKIGETVTLHVASDPAVDPKTRRKVEIMGANKDLIRELMYDRWVDRNAKKVDELSKGKLGYVHIPSMDEAGLDRFVRALYSDNFDKEAIVLDVRFNGGGFTHEQVLNYLGGKEHTLFKHRFGGEGLVLRSYDRKWTKPVVLVVNNRSFSDAEILPNAFREMGLGKIVGEPTGGFVIGTGALRLIDGSTFRIPRIGVFTAKGVNMDKEGVRPDVLVAPHPDELARDRDVQLEKAVEVLTTEVVEWKKKHGPIASKPEDKPGPMPLPMPMDK